MTFDIEHIPRDVPLTGVTSTVEIFAVCRHCRGGTSFTCYARSDYLSAFLRVVSSSGLHAFTDTINAALVDFHPITPADLATEAPPKYVPENVLRAFVEGQKTLAIDCFNASGAMARLTLDLATKRLLPPCEGSPDVTRRIKENLRDRIDFLIAQGSIPKALEDLAHQVRLDGNDAAHDGVLNETDARDLIEFCEQLLKACFEQPGSVAEAKRRREARRQS